MTIQQKVRFRILQVLGKRAHDSLIAHDILQREVMEIFQQPPSDGEYSKAMLRLENDGYISCIPSTLCGNLWGITASGRFLLSDTLMYTEPCDKEKTDAQ